MRNVHLCTSRYKCYIQLLTPKFLRLTFGSLNFPSIVRDCDGDVENELPPCNFDTAKLKSDSKDFIHNTFSHDITS